MLLYLPKYLDFNSYSSAQSGCFVSPITLPRAPMLEFSVGFKQGLYIGNMYESMLM